MYREWTTPPEEIPEAEEEREQLAIDIVDANRRECEESGNCVPLHNITWHVRHVDGFWYKVQYKGVDEEGKTHHSDVIYVNIATSEIFTEKIFGWVEIGG